MELADLIIRIVTLLVAIVGGGVGIASLIQKWKSDQRNAWWNRFQWSMDKILSASEADQGVGWATLPAIVDAALESTNDELMARAVLEFLQEQSEYGEVELREEGGDRDGKHH
ncbi:hypothetical protein [Corynebacterium halotolerans]|uniref:Uncharacterized protein n=1 Tax=Corynebacterium halotolerans YIM 70093 = DSM 44683 TaxID=1121362 RepID=M1MZA6_9CORY|nr:hypothetical protein [Corynebacterium halotolerans]AGF73014.1 hypothetical protein A605_10060 [Corynebacterium halotolerans YIM 70093 = DSM 44683]